MTSLTLPAPDGKTETYLLTGTPTERPSAPPLFNRIAYAAAHVVSDPRRDADPWGKPAVDWEGTLAFRHHLWSLGFKIAEAMDTAQRGMGLDWAGAQELISRSLAEARTVPGADLARQADSTIRRLFPDATKLFPCGISGRILSSAPAAAEIRSLAAQLKWPVSLAFMDLSPIEGVRQLLARMR